MTDKKLFAKNAVSGVFQKILIALLTFFTIPVFILKLGSESYGIFATVSVIGDLSRIANIGFHIALIKYLSYQGKTKESAIDIVVAFTAMLLIILPVSVLLIVFNQYVLIHILNIPVTHLAESKALYNYLVVANMFLFLGLTFAGMLESMKFIYKNNFLQLVYSVLYWSLILLVVSLGYNNREVGLMAFIAALVWFILMAYTALKDWGKLNIYGIRKLYWASVKKQLGYGLKIYTSGLIGLFGEPLVKVLIANFFGNVYVGFLDIGLRVKNQLYRIFQSALWPLFQLFSELKDKANTSRIVKEIGEKVTLLILPVSMVILFGSKPLVTLWIGRNIDIISLNLAVVTLCALIGQLIVQVNYNYYGVHHPWLLLVNSLVLNFFNLGIILLLHRSIGYDAIYISFIVSSFVNLVLGLYYQKRFLGYVIFENYKQSLRLLLTVVLLLVFGWLLTKTIVSPVILLCVLAIFMPVTSTLLYILFGLFTKNDIERYLGNHVVSKPFHYLFRIIRVIP